jgi:hypothetical protein
LQLLASQQRLACDELCTTVERAAGRGRAQRRA